MKVNYITVNENKLREVIINAIIARFNNAEITINGNKTSRWWTDARDTSLGGTVMTISGESTAVRDGDGVQINVTYTFAKAPRT